MNFPFLKSHSCNFILHVLTTRGLDSRPALCVCMCVCVCASSYPVAPRQCSALPSSSIGFPGSCKSSSYRPMSSLPFGFSSWRRSPSTPPEPAADEEDSTGHTSQSSLFAHADARLLSTSATSAAHREPTRSFIPGSARDHLCKFLPLKPP